MERTIPVSLHSNIPVLQYPLISSAIQSDLCPIPYVPYFLSVPFFWQ